MAYDDDDNDNDGNTQIADDQPPQQVAYQPPQQDAWVDYTPSPPVAADDTWVDYEPPPAGQTVVPKTAPATTRMQAPQESDWVDYDPDSAIATGAKLFGRGLTEGTGEALEGASTMLSLRPGMEPYYDLYSNWDKLDQDQRSDVISQVQNDPNLSILGKGFIQDQLRAREAGAPPMPIEDFAGSKPSDWWSSRAGQAIRSFGNWLLPETPETKEIGQTIPGQIISGIGQLAPAVGASLIDPALGAAMIAGQTARSTQEQALAQGMPAARAQTVGARAGGVSGATGLLMLEGMLAPVVQRAPGLASWAQAKLMQAGRAGLSFAGLGEAQSWLTAEATKDLDPSAGYSPDLSRMVVDTVTGAVLGPLHPVRHGTAGADAAAGTAQVQPPPAKNVEVGDPQNKVTVGAQGGETVATNLNTDDRGKETQEAPPGSGVNVGDTDPAIQAAVDGTPVRAPSDFLKLDGDIGHAEYLNRLQELRNAGQAGTSEFNRVSAMATLAAARDEAQEAAQRTQTAADFQQQRTQQPAAPEIPEAPAARVPEAPVVPLERGPLAAEAAAEPTVGDRLKAQQAARVADAVRSAADTISQRQGGVGTVFIGDIVKQLRAEGLTSDQVHEAIADAARSGRATLAESSTVNMTPAQGAGALQIEGERPFHTVTYRQPEQAARVAAEPIVGDQLRPREQAARADPSEQQIKPETSISKALDIINRLLEDERGAVPLPPMPAILGKTARSYKETFQPELISEDALKADAPIASYKGRRVGEQNRIYRDMKAQVNKWDGLPETEQLKFISDIEHGNKVDPQHQADANDLRRMLDEAYLQERQWGSKADYVENYLAHDWEQPAQARQIFRPEITTMGPTSFQKARTIDFIDEGLAAGLKLKSSNPFVIARARLMAGAEMRERMRMINDLRSMNLAAKVKQIGVATGIRAPQVEALKRAGWQEVNAPDREKWIIHPDVAPLWKNGVDAKGFWQNEGLTGDAFRAWMAFKAAWVPIKLALSAFHPLHVLGINFAQHFTAGLHQIVKDGDLAGAMKSFGRSVTPYSGYGREMRNQAMLAEHARTPEGKFAVQTMEDGGFSPWRSEIVRGGDAREKLTAAWKSMNPFKIAWHGANYLNPLRPVQEAIFDHWIPQLKTNAYLRDASILLKRDPTLQTDKVRRQVALRALAKSIDNRYGEMFYDNLFWNRYARDAGVGSFLSLGWNLGFAREFGGAMIEAATRPAEMLGLYKPSATRQLVRQSTNKITFATAYFASSALVAGLMTKLFTGQNPEGMDFAFPREGGTNADGSPRRMTTMFYSRELPMLEKHIEERGGWGPLSAPAGLLQMIMNKTMFEPFIELATNRSYFGREVWDINAPAYKQLEQTMSHILGEQVSPMSVAGLQQVRGAGATPAEQAMPVLGFGPAPSYANRSAMQNRIAYLYETRFGGTRPYEDPEVTTETRGARDRLLRAKQGGDPAAINAAAREALAAGLSRTYVKELGQVAGDQKMFKRLPQSDQINLLKQATPQERRRYWAFSSAKTKAQWNKDNPGLLMSGTH